jgi:hypothetical protein
VASWEKGEGGRVDSPKHRNTDGENTLSLDLLFAEVFKRWEVGNWRTTVQE